MVSHAMPVGEKGDTINSLSRPTAIVLAALQSLHQTDTGALYDVCRSLSDEEFNSADVHFNRQEVEKRMSDKHNGCTRAELNRAEGCAGNEK